ncbi:MAG: hypothetical protein PHU25_05870 [Deltaproteobacteria bacterium]|nr:hypothetical protein [Deltaproteobacteria bacterium]
MIPSRMWFAVPVAALSVSCSDGGSSGGGGGCASNEWKCIDNSCIDEDMRCNGVADCSMDEDEIGCGAGDAGSDADADSDSDSDADSDADGDTHTGDCGSRPCCNSGSFAPLDQVCDTTPYAAEYKCGGNDCGADAVARYRYKHCTGDNEDCGNGHLVWDTEWTVLDDCDTNEECAASDTDATCTSCPNGCESGECVMDWCGNYPGSDECCQSSNPCSLADDGNCDCSGYCTWDSYDCTQGDYCSGYTGTDTCCQNTDPCLLANNLYCDCGGFCSWDFYDCH